MPANEYSFIVELPLYDVLAQLSAPDEAPGQAARDLRCEVLAGGTRITLTGDRADVAPLVLASVVRSFTSQVLHTRHSTS